MKSDWIAQEGDPWVGGYKPNHTGHYAPTVFSVNSVSEKIPVLWMTAD